LLCQIAWSAVHTKETFFAGLFCPLEAQSSKAKGLGVAQRIAKVIWLQLHERVEYQERDLLRQPGT